MTPAELRKRRKALGLSQSALGQAIGVAGNTVARWERAEAPIGNPELVRLALERLELAPGGVTASAPGGPAQPSVNSDIPAQLSSFVGREREVAEIRQLLEATRLVTLTGAGGVGKTRVALRVAEEFVERFADGVLFVPLAPITDPPLVTAAIAQLLDVRDVTGRPLRDLVQEVLRAREMLLVLDNFEQVLPAAPQLAELLGACPRLKMLVTSRAVLHISGEHTYAVPSLKLPDRDPPPPLERLTQYEAVRLFVERGRAARTDFAVTNDSAPALAEICARLDGLPLAIELAAARVRVLTPQAILARLARRLDLLVGGARDTPERHQTLRAAIAWSMTC